MPAAAIAMGISSMLAQSVPARVSPRIRFHLNRVFVALAVGAALSFSLAGSDIGALLLLTYGGLTQLAPAIAAELADKVRLSAPAAISGITVGTVTVAVITFGAIPIGSWDSGLLALGPNLVVTAVVESVVRARRHHAARDELEAAPATAA